MGHAGVDEQQQRPSAVPPTLADLREQLPELTLRDQRRLRRRLDGTRKVGDSTKRQSVLDRIATDIDGARQRVERRRAAVPAIMYPDALPVAQRKDELLAAIRDHQVVVVAGETGSGKTTQLPKICLELGRGVLGTIGHTQPRRLAARTVAERIADELGTAPGETVGWKVRFTDKVSDHTLVKVMTDGILLAEIHSDRELEQYDTLIIDEAHERSLNIDFILGYVKQLLPRRPDLKVIVTSATIDPDRFARYFSEGGDDVPIVEVSGRTYPVEVRHRPVVDPDDPQSDPDRDQIQAICDAVDELGAEGPGDILVFLSGEREIRDTADALGRQNLRDTEILPLYARLSSAEQHRVFQPHRGRRIVLATNVAETSLTVPGIRYVIDPGTARISRYSYRTKVQRLPIEPISQASANQRTGRCGRTSDGICIRLYTQEDFLARPEFTDPEILRTNLASVILAMAAAELGDIARFPFLDPPDHRNVRAGVQLLEELGALDPGTKRGAVRLTPTGRKLAQLPVDPRLARMVIEADRNGCLREVSIIAAALAIQDPRERPADHRQAADQMHARFADERSDFLAFVNLWRYLREQQQKLSGNQFRKLCRREFLSYLRVREWQDVTAQLRQIARSLGASVNTKPADPDRIHQSLLAGLLSHVGLRDAERRDYQGARGTRFSIFPGSVLFKRGQAATWVVAAELVETSKLWGRIVARIEPDWVEALAGHLVKRSYSEPHWSKKQGAVMAYEKVTLYGVPIVARRRVSYGGIDPELSRELFIRHALVDGEWDTRHEFFHENRTLLDEVTDLEHRARRRDIVVDDQTLFDFYDQRVGSDVVSARHFDTWWKNTRQEQPDLLTFSASMLINDDATGVREEDYPDYWEQGDLRLRLTYQFEPGGDADGVTVHIPLPVLYQVDADELGWQVPGLREELVTAWIRSLPKQLRRNLVPAPEYAKAALQRLSRRSGPILPALERELHQLSGVAIPREAWQPGRIPEHLTMTFQVEGDDGQTTAVGKDLDELRRQVQPEVRQLLSRAAATIERRGIRSWDFGSLPQTFERRLGAQTVRAYPALADENDSVAIRLFETPAHQHDAMWRGTRRLLLLTIPSPVKSAADRLSTEAKLALGSGPHSGVGALLDDCLACAADKLVADAGGPAWDESGFAKLRDDVRAELADALFDVLVEVERIVTAARDAERRLQAMTNPALLASVTDIRNQLAGLVYPDFATATGWERLRHLPRYLRAVERRLDKLGANPERDRARSATLEQLQQEYQRMLGMVSPGSSARAELREIRWMLEELRVSYFAQELGTAYPVSEKRIRQAMHRAITPIAG